MSNLLFVITLLCSSLTFQATTTRAISGVIVTDKNEAVAGATITAHFASGEQKTISDASGGFSLTAPLGSVTIKVEGKNLEPVERSIAADEATDNLMIRARFIVPPIHESVVIQA